MTKRHLGIIFILLGSGVIAVLFVMDLLGASRFDGIGPMQQLAIAAAAVAILVGLSLIPLGDRPA